MEISLQGSQSLKIRGKHAAVFINPQDKTASYNAAIILGNPARSTLKIRDDVVVIQGPGEYEAGGIKISGTRIDGQTIYSMSFDGLDIVIGTRASLEKGHQKLKEHTVAIVMADSQGTVSFVPALAMTATLFFGEHALELVDSLAKEEKKEMTKYVLSADKLPTETETILLSSSS